MIVIPQIKKYFGIKAITLWKWVIYGEKEPDLLTVNHERIHLDQIKRDGPITFYYIYLYEYFSYRLKGISKDISYRSISYEVEAYENQNNLDYIVK